MAEEHKKSFMLYFDNFPCVAALDAEQRGELLLLLYRYAMAADKAPTDPEEVLRQHPGLREETPMAYRFLAETIRRDTEKWKEKQRRYQEAAARRQGLLWAFCSLPAVWGICPCLRCWLWVDCWQDV